tara:strand:- start:391 stop:807 length:417 start_codon:yes stop_codon:yes gene_type:complete
MSKEKDKKKPLREKSSKKMNIVPFKTKSLKEQKIETDKEIWERVDTFSKELVHAFKQKATKEAISKDECFYIFYYRVMQSLMLEMSYPSFKFYTNWTKNQLLQHHKNFMNSLDEWTIDQTDNEDVFGRKKTNKDKTLH